MRGSILEVVVPLLLTSLAWASLVEAFHVNVSSHFVLFQSTSLLIAPLESFQLPRESQVHRSSREGNDPLMSVSKRSLISLVIPHVTGS